MTDFHSVLESSSLSGCTNFSSFSIVKGSVNMLLMRLVRTRVSGFKSRSGRQFDSLWACMVSTEGNAVLDEGSIPSMSTNLDR
jgi:hypothetical protein